MSTTSQTSSAADARIDGVEVSAYEVPTATEKESDGMLEWDSTTLVVVEIQCGEHTGLGLHVLRQGGRVGDRVKALEHRRGS